MSYEDDRRQSQIRSEMRAANAALQEQNELLRKRVANLENREKHYIAMAQDASRALINILRGEPFEGWIDPQLDETTPESANKLKARLKQAKLINHSRYEQLKRCVAENRRLHGHVEKVERANRELALELHRRDSLIGGQ